MPKRKAKVRSTLKVDDLIVGWPGSTDSIGRRKPKAKQWTEMAFKVRATPVQAARELRECFKAFGNYQGIADFYGVSRRQVIRWAVALGLRGELNESGFRGHSR